MRIESLEVQNFKVLRHLLLNDIPDLVIIAGPNGAGKTSLFDAIRVFKEAIATYSLQHRGGVYISTLLQQIGPVVRAGESEATITAAFRVSEEERRAISLPDEHTGLLRGTVTVRSTGNTGQQESAFLASSGNENADGAYLTSLLGGYRTGGDVGMIDHIGPDRRFTPSQVTNISFSDQEEEQELQRLVLNTTDKFASLTQDLVRMRFIDMQEQSEGVEEPYRYIEGVRQIFQHFLPDQELVEVKLARRFAKATGSSTRTIWELERGRRLPRPSTLRKFAKVLGVPVGDVEEFQEAIRRKASRGAPPEVLAEIELMEEVPEVDLVNATVIRVAAQRSLREVMQYLVSSGHPEDVDRIYRELCGEDAGQRGQVKAKRSSSGTDVGLERTEPNAG